MGLLAPWVLVALGMTIPLSGSVEDAGGRPVEGATVWLVDPYRKEPGADVLAEVKTDAQGRFRIDRPDDLKGRAPSGSPTLWAHKPGSRFAFVEFRRRVPGPDEPVRLVLGPSASTPVRVLLPGGGPAPGARVRLVQASFPATRMPLGLLDRIASTTDAEGRAALEGVRPEDVSRLDVTAEGLVTQCHAFDPPSPDDKTVSLRPVGRLAIRVVSDDPNAVRGWTITATTTPAEPGYRGPSTSWARATSDELGLAELRPLAEGRIGWTVEPPRGSSYLALPPPGLINRAGQSTEVKVAIRRGVRVEGTVVEQPGGAPVPGASFTLLPAMYNGFLHPQVSDEAGRFSFLILPGPVELQLRQFPKTHYQPRAPARPIAFELKEGEERRTLAPVELRRAAQVRGKVLDESGQPVARVGVNGHWRGPEFGEESRSVHDSTDDRGEFVLGSIAPGAEVGVSAWLPLFAEATPEKATAGDDRPVTLRLRRRPTVALVGRVLDQDGRPVAGAEVRIRLRAPGHEFNSGGEATLEPSEEIRTGADGSFRTSAEVPVGNQYRADVRSIGGEPSESAWISSPAVAFPEVRLRRATRTRLVAGRVLDTGGKPLAGAEVHQSGDGPRRTGDSTDIEGRFQVRGVPDSPAFLFVRKPGYRYLGRRVDPSDQAVDFVVTRIDEPPTVPLKPAAAAMSRAEERAMVRELLAPAWERVLAGSGDGSERAQALQSMALVEPSRIAGMIEDQVLQADPALLANLALARSEDDPRQAIGLLEAIGDPDSATWAFLSLFDRLADAPIDFRRDLLDRALRRGREVASPMRKITLLGQVADRWLDLDDPGRATPIAREVQGLLGALTKDDFPDPRGELAEALARVDLPAALKLLEGEKEGYGLDRHRARIAGRVAATDPAEALRLLGLIQNASEKYGARATICLRMATGDLPRARALADEHGDPTLSAVLPAVAARKLAATDPKSARALLLESFDRLSRLAWADGSRSHNAPVVAMARLLPLAARVDPERAPGYFWLTLAARPPLSAGLEPRPVLPETRRHYADLAELAMLIARHDRSAAEVVFAPVAGRVPAIDDPMWGLGNEGEAIFRAATAYDPRAARALLDALPEDPSPSTGRASTGPGFRHATKANARMTVARTLALAPDLRRHEPLRKVSGNDWLAGLED